METLAFADDLLIEDPGLNLAFQARCAVVAVANPIEGRYDQQRSNVENYGKPFGFHRKTIYNILQLVDFPRYIRINNHDPETEHLNIQVPGLGYELLLTNKSQS